MNDVTDVIRHIVPIGKEKIYLMAGADGSYMTKFADENKPELAKTRMYLDGVLDKISELNRR